MPTFDILVVGSGGGPDELDLSAYLLKPTDAIWQDGIIGLEAGSGLGALNRILRRNPYLLGSATHTAFELYSYVNCFLISHAHFDHISGLVLSAGSLGGGRKRVYALRDTLDNIASVFNDRLWPNLASFDECDEQHKLHLCPIRTHHYTMIHESISVFPLRLSHGASSESPGIPILSTAFFVRHDPTRREILFFGDVEPDALSLNPMNRNVWRIAAPKIPHTLSAIFIECSWKSDRSDDTLYGHLTPRHLVNELVVLAREVWKVRTSQDFGTGVTIGSISMGTGPHTSPSLEELRGILNGLSIYIIHCKSDVTSDRPVRKIIEEEVKELIRDNGLGANVLAVEQGSILHV
ncbi:hypothetical protein APHAL10511_001338 [Amanita phalloides]|nr:hypothetical protein APHAL10511_001338 [Amanita phalloides]